MHHHLVQYRGIIRKVTRKVIKDPVRGDGVIDVVLHCRELCHGRLRRRTGFKDRRHKVSEGGNDVPGKISRHRCQIRSQHANRRIHNGRSINPLEHASGQSLERGTGTICPFCLLQCAVVGFLDRLRIALIRLGLDIQLLLQVLQCGPLRFSGFRPVLRFTLQILQLSLQRFRVLLAAGK